MTIRRYIPMKPSSGTRIPDEVRRFVILRDAGCVGPRVGMPTDCAGGIELDHVRASGGLGMKSASEPSNLVSLCSFHHKMRTEHGRKFRPLLLEYLDNATRRLSETNPPASGEKRDPGAETRGASSRW